jgi:hypothetical protein
LVLLIDALKVSSTILSTKPLGKVTQLIKR